jgi:hypothetical protein
VWHNHDVKNHLQKAEELFSGLSKPKTPPPAPKIQTEPTPAADRAQVKEGGAPRRRRIIKGATVTPTPIPPSEGESPAVKVQARMSEAIASLGGTEGADERRARRVLPAEVDPKVPSRVIRRVASQPQPVVAVAPAVKAVVAAAPAVKAVVAVAPAVKAVVAAAPAVKAVVAVAPAVKAVVAAAPAVKRVVTKAPEAELSSITAAPSDSYLIKVAAPSVGAEDLCFVLDGTDVAGVAELAMAQVAGYMSAEHSGAQWNLRSIERIKDVLNSNHA